MTKKKIMTKLFINPFLIKRIKEIMGMIILAYAIFQFGALLTYHPLDPSFANNFDNQVSNFMGKYGSYSANFLLEYFGYSSYILIFSSLIWGVSFIKKALPNLILLRLSSLLFTIIIISFLLATVTFNDNSYFFSYGGITGLYIYTILNKILPLIITLPVAFLLGVILFSYAHSFKILSLLVILKLLIIYSSKCLKKLTIAIFNLQKKILLKIILLIQKIFFKRRIKNIDSSDNTSKKIHTKIDKETIPKLTQVEYDYKLPELSLLEVNLMKKKKLLNKDKLLIAAKDLHRILTDFGVSGKILDVKPGPVVTLYEFEPSPGIKSSRIIGLADDIARSMGVVSVRISVVPEKNALGIEMPNDNRATVYLKELLESDEYQNNELNIPLALGKNIGGTSINADLSRMPHLLVAGTTGSGKSVAINTMILSIIYKLSPDECKFIMVDPKMLELSVYEGIPHLLTPVVTDPKKAVIALQWVVREMENRYKLMSSLGVRNIAGYNQVVKEAIAKKEILTRTVQTGFDEITGKPVYETVELDMQSLPYIVVIIDEMADLMLVAGKEIESYIQRLAQMARAAGIHLIIATQRPSVDVITGIIKANFPTRISFQVTSKIDSRTILGQQGAEQLLGMGDMLYMHGGSKITRIHGAFVSDKEVNDVVSSLKNQAEPVYIADIFNNTEDGDESSDGIMKANNEGDELYNKAVEIVLKDKKISISYIQRQLRIGYNRAANIIEQMEQSGVISPPAHNGKREILQE